MHTTKRAAQPLREQLLIMFEHVMVVTLDSRTRDGIQHM